MPVSVLVLAPFFLLWLFLRHAQGSIRCLDGHMRDHFARIRGATIESALAWHSRAGVVVGLSWGVISLIYNVLLAFGARDFDHSPEMP